MLQTELLREARIALQQAIEAIDHQLAQSANQVVIVEKRTFKHTTRKGYVVTVKLGKSKGK